MNASVVFEGFLRDSFLLFDARVGGERITEFGGGQFFNGPVVPYAVVLLTSDDIGGPQGSADQKPRARQNVIFALEYFIGTLGRDHVCALKTAGVEVPSDLAGVLYVDLDAGGAWQLRLAKEMRQAGLDVDLNLAI